MPIIKGYATLREMQEYYDLDDVIDMHIAISLQAKVEERSNRSE